jgi:hypothetical protein
LAVGGLFVKRGLSFACIFAMTTDYERRKTDPKA